MTRAALVIGGGGGIGSAVARALCEKDFRVALADFDADRVRGVAESLGPKALHLQVDVRREDSVSAMVDAAADRLGRLDALFCLHGVVVGRTKIMDLPYEEWRFVLDTNLGGAFLCMKHVIPRMLREGGGGCVVSLTTTQARAGQSSYFSSKAGIEGLTAVAAEELKTYGIGVYVLSPGGYLSTSFHDNSYKVMPYRNYVSEEAIRSQRKPLRPEIVVPVCMHLIEDRSLRLTGKRIDVPRWNEENGFGGLNQWYAL